MASTSGPRFDLPTIEPESQPFWDAAKGGVLMLGHCKTCDATHYYPRPTCPQCWSQDVELKPASGRGVVYTYSTIYVNDLAPFNAQLPYVAAMVDLEEGVRISTNIVNCPANALQIGMPVALQFKLISEDVAIPVFQPATA
jgi:uncharacterized protein